MKNLGTLIKIHGGKHYLAKWIISHFPPNYQQMHYVEPYCGGASVLLQKEPSIIETISDIDWTLFCLWSSIKWHPDIFLTQVKKLTYSEDTFNFAKEHIKYYPGFQPSPNRFTISYGVYRFCVNRMSRGGLGKDFAWSDRQRGGKPGDINAWENAIKRIPQISKRLDKVRIYSEDATRLIQDRIDDKNILWYLDPPYLQSTRSVKSVYQYEMSEQNHIDLSKLLLRCKGKVILSAYRSALYDQLYQGWRREDKIMPNHASQANHKNRRTESLYISY